MSRESLAGEIGGVVNVRFVSVGLRAVLTGTGLLDFEGYV